MDRVGHRAPHVNLGGVMVEDGEAAGRHEVPRRRRADVGLDEPHAGRHVLPPSRREVVEDGNLVARREVGLHDMGADEPGAPGDEHATGHRGRPGRTGA